MMGMRYVSFMKLQVVLQQGEDGYYVAHCPSLKSCWTQGKTREEALGNIREAIELYLEPNPAVQSEGKSEVYELSL